MCGWTYRIELPVSESEQLSKEVAPAMQEEVTRHELQDESPQHAR